jgi:chemotaxis signal transduction protein
MNEIVHYVPPGYYLFLSQGRENFCNLDMVRVRRIIGLLDLVQRHPTPIHPHDGIELWGKILPLIDFRRGSASGGRPYDEEACILVVEIQMGDHVRLTGLVVETIHA